MHVEAQVIPLGGMFDASVNYIVIQSNRQENMDDKLWEYLVEEC